MIRFTLILVGALAVALPAQEAPRSADAKPTLKLIKYPPGVKRTKRIVTREGKRRVLVKVKRVPAPDSTVVTPLNPVPVNESLIETVSASDKAPITEYFYVDEEGDPVGIVNEESNTSAAKPAPQEPVFMTEAQTTDTNATTLPADTEKPADEPKTAPLAVKSAPPVPTSTGHYVTLSAGSVVKNIETTIYTSTSGDTLTIDPGAHTFTANGGKYVFDESVSYTALSAGYLYRPAMQGHAFYLSGYYDNHVAELRAGYHFAFDDLAGFYPAVKLTGGLGYENADGYKPDAYSGGVSFLLDRKISEGVIMGLEGGIVYRDWADVEEYFGVMDRKDTETVIRLTLSYGLD